LRGTVAVGLADEREKIEAPSPWTEPPSQPRHRSSGEWIAVSEIVNEWLERFMAPRRGLANQRGSLRCWLASRVGL
jgi:hypothetical protein